jgi:hypothetical protein
VGPFGESARAFSGKERVGRTEEGKIERERASERTLELPASSQPAVVKGNTPLTALAIVFPVAAAAVTSVLSRLSSKQERERERELLFNFRPREEEK